MAAARRWAALLPACERAVLPLGVIALLYYGGSIGVEKLYQSRSKRFFERETGERGVTAEATALSLAGDVLGFKPPVGRLRIPTLGLDVMVIEGTNDSDLNRAVGHIPGTSALGGDGNAGIAGHRDGFFKELRELAKGDPILVTTREGEFTYRVRESRIVAPGDVQVLDPGDAPSLTLVTCYPFGFVGPAPKRFVVLADLGS
jgi:LPXTG-site transpeptidase (sortase) family protein